MDKTRRACAKCDEEDLVLQTDDETVCSSLTRRHRFTSVDLRTEAAEGVNQTFNVGLRTVNQRIFGD